MASNFLSVYRRSYSRAIQHAIGSGFYARDLDADDVAFIERVRETGNVSCGSLVDIIPTDASIDYRRHSVLLEELDYWQSPWAREPNIVWRKRPAETPEARAERIARKLQEKAAQEAELARARSEWAKEQVQREQERLRRLLRMKKEDREWEAAEPARRTRHYKPIWKREEETRARVEIEIAQAAERAAKEAAREAEREKREKERAEREAIKKEEHATWLAAARKLAAERAAAKTQAAPTSSPQQGPQPRPDNWPSELPEPGHMHVRDRVHVFVRDADAASLMATHGQRLRYCAQYNGMTHFMVLHGLEVFADEQAFDAELKRRIMIAMKQAAPLPPTIETLMALTGCKDRVRITRLANELAAAGYSEMPR